MGEYDHIIIAVHGIGDQMRNETVRSVATRLARIPTLAGNQILIAPQPLGYFHSDVRNAVKVAPLDKISNPASPFTKLGFTEVYWADIPDVFVNEGHTLEETKAWARTVVSRARAVFRRATSNLDLKSMSFEQRLQFHEPDFSLAGEVLDEIVDALYVIENLCFLADKAGIGKFDLREILRRYVGDVQMVTEFTIARYDIVGRFHRAMEQITEKYPEATLHIVAHSEGTVVSFLGILHAISGDRMTVGKTPEEARIQQNQRLPDWLKKVQGYMTIGSPIDKHILLWPELFEGLSVKYGDQLTAGQIIWRNYYDYGDPVGFKLDTARAWLKEKNCGAFDFTPNDDIGFSRYLFPGKAHNDYWADPAVFEHFVSQTIFRNLPAFKSPPIEKPKSRWVTSIVSPAIPYAVSFLILFAGTTLFYRTVAHYTHPPQDMVHNYVSLMTLGEIPKEGTSGVDLLCRSLGLTMLVAGTTLLARWPRLAKEFLWFFAGTVAFVIGCISYLELVPPPAQKEIGILFFNFGINPAAGVLGVALLVALVGMTVIIKPKSGLAPDESEKRGLRAQIHKEANSLFHRRTSRRLRWFSQGMRPLIACGAVAIALLVLYQISHPRSRSENIDTHKFETNYIAWSTNAMASTNSIAASEVSIASIQSKAASHAELTRKVFEVQPSIWPVVVAGAVFLYLWWLAALVFDLAFVWQRYIRQSVMLDRMHCWREKTHRANPEKEAPASAG